MLLASSTTYSSTTVSASLAPHSRCYLLTNPITEGTSEYTTCTNLLTTSGGTYPGSSLFEIAANGVSLDKLVIGKPGNSGDADSGYIAPATLAGCVEQAKSQGWGEWPQLSTSGPSLTTFSCRCRYYGLGGMSLLLYSDFSGSRATQFPDAASSWITTVRSEAFPV